ncbi:peptidylprolyl isomerase [Lysinibacillus piscis]|uniref:Foldase protein PrsA n=1 Tax=Lysinibacillus piscis TaxID=2518931 RepID=A0ABQ5NNB2_9BACI|nr:peptidylprolyl isomerase [Lysinibacillus sp. KH24]GLC89881.1 foldase protein PrsA [Lysinibacillus sp. KH24]
MKKTVLSLTLAASVLTLGACSGGDDKALVTSKIGDISIGEFNETAKNLAGAKILQQMVTEKVLADKYKVSDKEIQEAYDSVAAQLGDNFAQALKQYGMTEDSFKESLRVELLQDKALEETLDTKKYYEQMKSELNARHILVADQETARAVIEKLKSGAAFADVAKEYSTDTGSKEKGGELGWFSVGAMVDEFNDAAYELPLNTISEPVKSAFGYHIIEVTDKRDVKDIGSYEEEKEKISQTMLGKLKQSDEFQTKAQDIVAKLIKEANFKTSDKNLQGALDTLSMTSEEQAKAAEEAAKKEEKKEDKK